MSICTDRRRMEKSYFFNFRQQRIFETVSCCSLPSILLGLAVSKCSNKENVYVRWSTLSCSRLGCFVVIFIGGGDVHAAGDVHIRNIPTINRRPSPRTCHLVWYRPTFPTSYSRAQLCTPLLMPSHQPKPTHSRYLL